MTSHEARRLGREFDGAKEAKKKEIQTTKIFLDLQNNVLIMTDMMK